MAANRTIYLTQHQITLLQEAALRIDAENNANTQTANLTSEYRPVLETLKSALAIICPYSSSLFHYRVEDGARSTYVVSGLLDNDETYVYKLLALEADKVKGQLSALQVAQLFQFIATNAKIRPQEKRKFTEINDDEIAKKVNAALRLLEKLTQKKDTFKFSAHVNGVYWIYGINDPDFFTQLSQLITRESTFQNNANIASYSKAFLATYGIYSNRDNQAHEFRMLHYFDKLEKRYQASNRENQGKCYVLGNTTDGPLEFGFSPPGVNRSHHFLQTSKYYLERKGQALRVYSTMEDGSENVIAEDYKRLSILIGFNEMLAELLGQATQHHIPSMPNKKKLIF